MSSKVTNSTLVANLVGLTIASLSCIAILTVAVVGRSAPSSDIFGPRGLLIVGVLSGLVIFLAVAGLLFLRAARSANRFELRAGQEIAQLQRTNNALRDALSDHHMIVVLWEEDRQPRIIADGASGVSSLPAEISMLLNPQQWLGARQGQLLANKIDGLLETGEAFELSVRTNAGECVLCRGQINNARAFLILGLEASSGESEGNVRRTDSSGATLAGLADALPIPIWHVDGGGRIVWCNGAYARALGQSDAASITKTQTHLLEGRQRDEIARALASGATYGARHHVVVEGERHAYDIFATPSLQGASLAAIDAEAIDRLKQAYEGTIAAHERTFDRVATAIAIFGADQRLTFHNAAFQQLWQLDQDWLNSRPRDGEILDRLRESGRLPDEGIDYRTWKDTILNRNRQGDEADPWWHLPDGRAIRVMVEQRSDGGVTYLYDDVTEQLALESRFNAMIGVQRETLDHLKEGVSVFATDGRLRLFNPAFGRIWRLKPEFLKQEPHVEAIIEKCLEHFDDSRTWGAIKRSVTAFVDRRQPIEGHMERPDGRIVAYAGLPLPDGATLLTFSDVTDSKRVERALIEKNEALEAAARLKNSFISNISYELRTPLTNIIGFSELLASQHAGELNPKQREYLGDIHASSNTLLSIINDILDLATIDAGEFELRLRRAKVQSLIQSAAQAVRERLNRARMTLNVEIDQDVGEIVADGERVTQILFNLISNAIGFSSPGDVIEIAARLEGPEICLIVKDHGCGIPPDSQEKIFERFERHTRGSKHRGAGLGLAIVKSLVDLHGGTIVLSSIVDEGTTVEVRLPVNGHQRGPDLPGGTVTASGKAKAVPLTVS